MIDYKPPISVDAMRAAWHPEMPRPEPWDFKEMLTAAWFFTKLVFWVLMFFVVNGFVIALGFFIVYKLTAWMIADLFFRR